MSKKLSSFVIALFAILCIVLNKMTFHNCSLAEKYYLCRQLKSYILINRMGRLSQTWTFIGRFKYIITIVFGVAVVGFLDENSLKKRLEHDLTIKDLQEEINRYQTLYSRDSAQLVELRNNPRAMSKIARERYFMKADDEDIYVLSDDESQREEQNEKTE